MNPIIPIAKFILAWFQYMGHYVSSPKSWPFKIRDKPLT
jgi:hypothetical protein